MRRLPILAVLPISLALLVGAGDPGGSHHHAHDAEEAPKSPAGIYLVEACVGPCSGEDRRLLYRGHVVFLAQPLDPELFRGRPAWDDASFAQGANGCVAVRRHRDGAGAALAEATPLNTGIAWRMTEDHDLAFDLAGEPVRLRKVGRDWVGTIGNDGAIVVWPVGSGGPEYCLSLAK